MGDTYNVGSAGAVGPGAKTTVIHEHSSGEAGPPEPARKTTSNYYKILAASVLIAATVIGLFQLFESDAVFGPPHEFDNNIIMADAGTKSAANQTLDAASNKRAFVVGVNEYEHLSQLRNPVRDAAGYEGLFRDKLGYQVSRPTGDLKRRNFVAAFDEFTLSIAPGDEVAFVFSGHGWSNGGENYLSFSDAPRGVSEAVLRSETIALRQYVMSRLRARNPKLLIAIIDACRDEQYDSLTKSGGALEKGFVRIDAKEGELILYSAGEGQTSLDRLHHDDQSPYSVFTRALLPRLSDTNKPLARIANETRAEVKLMAATVNHSQVPVMMLGLDIDYCLSGECVDAPSLSEKVVSDQNLNDLSGTEPRHKLDQISWTLTEETIDDFEVELHRGDSLQIYHETNGLPPFYVDLVFPRVGATPDETPLAAARYDTAVTSTIETYPVLKSGEYSAKVVCRPDNEPAEGQNGQCVSPEFIFHVTRITN